MSPHLALIESLEQRDLVLKTTLCYLSHAIMGQSFKYPGWLKETAEHDRVVLRLMHSASNRSEWFRAELRQVCRQSRELRKQAEAKRASAGASAFKSWLTELQTVAESQHDA